MKTFGIIYCCYGTPEYIYPSLENWIKLKDKYNIKIAAVNGMFKEMRELGYVDYDIETETELNELNKTNELDYLYIQNDTKKLESEKKYQTEAEIRNKALQWLLKDGADTIILLDSDEKFTETDIENLIELINSEDNKLYPYFRINFKNLTFSDLTYTKGFRPKRIWRTEWNGLKLNKIFYDNDFEFIDKNGKIILDDQLPCKLISEYKVYPLHYTWNDYERSCKKISYQEKHFQHGAGCSFVIDKENKKIIWNEEYFKKIGQNPPELYNI